MESEREMKERVMERDKREIQEEMERQERE